MLIAVVSDTHRRTTRIKQAIAIIGKANPDKVIHLGDNMDDADLMEAMLGMEVITVPGNCDYSSEKDFKVIEAGHLRIFATHGHAYGVKRGLHELAKAAKDNGCHIALYGHTHVASEDSADGILTFNPGSAAEPRGGQKPTIGFIEIKGNKTGFRFAGIDAGR
jgi:hypothetical protein